MNKRSHLAGVLGATGLFVALTVVAAGAAVLTTPASLGTIVDATAQFYGTVGQSGL